MSVGKMRSTFATLLVILVVKEGSCRSPGRTVPWPALIRPEDDGLAKASPGSALVANEIFQERYSADMRSPIRKGRASSLDMPLVPGDTSHIPDNMLEPPKGLIRYRRSTPWVLAGLPVPAGVQRIPKAQPNVPKMMHPGAHEHLTGHRRDRRFAPWADLTVAQVPQLPTLPGGLPQIPETPQLPQGTPQLPQEVPKLPKLPSVGRKRRSPKDNKKEKEHKPEEKPEGRPEGRPEGKPEEKPEMKGKKPRTR